MRNIPGTYAVRGMEKVHRRISQLVSVRAAKQLGIDIHGSAERLAGYLPQRSPSLRRCYDFRRYHEAPLEAPGCDMSTLPAKSNIGNDPFAGVASLRVPWITDSGSDWGYLCEGCQTTHRDFRMGRLPSIVISELSPSDVRVGNPIFAMATRLHSRQGLLAHAERCYGFRQLLGEVGSLEREEIEMISTSVDTLS